MNMTNENETSGTQLNLLKLTPCEVENVYALITASPVEIPNAEIENKIFRPALSTRKVHKKAPMHWTMPTIMEETFGDNVDPDSSKIVFVKFIIGKQPQN